VGKNNLLSKVSYAFIGIMVFEIDTY